MVRGAAAREAEQQPARAPVRPAGHADARARRRRTGTCGATSSSTPTRRSTCTPTRSTPGRCSPTASPAPATCSPATGRPASSPRTRLVQWANQRLNTLVLDEDIDLVDNVQQGLPTRGYRCGPLSRREAAVAWFADRVRADLAPVLGAATSDRARAPRRRRARADPRRRGAADRQRGDRRRADRPDRDGRRRLDARSCTTTSTAARPCWPRRSTTPTRARATSGSPSGEPAGASHAERLQLDDRPVPADHAVAARGLGAVGRAVAARGPPSGAAPGRRGAVRPLHAWFADEIAAGVATGEFARCDPHEVADRTLALIDGFGIRTLIGDSTIPLERARRAVAGALARDLGLASSWWRPATGPARARAPASPGSSTVRRRAPQRRVASEPPERRSGGARRSGPRPPCSPPPSGRSRPRRTAARGSRAAARRDPGPPAPSS